MKKLHIGIRKCTERMKVRYWLLIYAQVVDSEERKKSIKSKLTYKNWPPAFFSFIEDPYWVLFIVITIVINLFITINAFPYSSNDYFVHLAVVVHLTCLFYWIDFLVAVAIRVSNKSNVNFEKNRKIGYFIMDAISLLPVSTVYLLVHQVTNCRIFWLLRGITLVRCYRIPLFLSKIATVERSHWKILVFTYTFYVITLIDLFANYWIMQTDIHYEINDWNASTVNTFIVCFYFSCVTCLNVGFGDITPQTPTQMVICCLAMISGFIITTGVLNGALATGLANQEKRREVYRIEYESIVTAMKKTKIDKRIIDKISDNLLNFWSYKKGLTSSYIIHYLPLSMQKEIYFDLNFGVLNRSLIFSLQPRSFLRSVSLMMKNMSLFPGDTIMEPFGMSEAMICVVTGIIEILSDENDDSPLISFTTGTIIGEASLFMSIPVKYVLRASTNVELQVLTKGNFSRLALKYTDIYRSMRSEIISRFEFSEKAPIRELDKDMYELSKRKATKYLLNELKKSRNSELKKDESTYSGSYKSSLLNLYVLSENIPRVKTLPINLIKAKPWILRPNTTLTNIWEIFIVLVVIIVSYIYPCLAGFVRKVKPEVHVFLILIECIYIIDLYIQCTTAIERNDHFTYITSIKQIVSYKLKSVQFYVDILATYDLTVYAKFIMPQDPDYAVCLLSLNRLLKFWHIPHYFLKLENNMTMNLLLLRTMKYLFYYSVAVVWSAVILILEACPEENCNGYSWYANLESKEVNESNPTPTTPWPEIISLYFGSVIVSAVGYGDIVPKAIPDCWAVSLCLFLGLMVVIYCTAEASATFKHLERHRAHYREEVFAVNRFMTDHEIPKNLQNEVRNYFRMQWNYDRAFSLKHHQTIETMMTQQREIFLMELMKKFLTVPVFQQADTDFLKMVAKSCKIRVLPPDEIVTNAGSFVRELYILENGYCEVSTNENRSVIGPLTPFGYLEMILGIPQLLDVRTLTHARILSLDYAFYLRAVTKYSNVKSQIDLLTNKMYSNLQARENPLEIFTLHTFPIETTRTENDTMKSIFSGQFINVYSYHKSMSNSYWEPFRRWGKLRIFQIFLIPFVVSPHSLFLKIWTIFRIICVFLIGLIAPIHFSLYQFTKEYENVILVLQIFSWLDIYLMFHVAYYDSRGLLMFHPAKTATWYLKHSFVLDLITTFPTYLITRALFSNNDVPTYYCNGPGFIMALQFYKFFQACHYLESDILGALPNIKILKFVPLALIITNIITGFLILLECQTVQNSAPINITVKDFKTEFEENIQLICSYNNKKSDVSVEELRPIRFYLSAYYWVTTTMTTCGFGDITAHDKTTMIAVMIIIIFGLFLYGYIFASLTSSMISAYNSVAKYRRRMREMSTFMKYMNANNDIQQRLILHYEYNWHRSEGANPQKMFLYVHAALRETIVTSMYEETIRQVPAFIDVERSVIRVLGKYSEEVYFLNGEIIMKYNDVQEYVYIIYRGKVDVRSVQGKYITSMGCGGIFGNITKSTFALSSVTVIATTNVDILRLNSDMFFKALEIFPNTKALVEFFYTRTTDYIQPLEVPRDSPQHSGRSTTYLKDKSRIDTVPYERSLKRLRPMIQYSDTPNIEENYFHFKNSVFLLPHKKISGMVILHDSWLSTVIEILIFFIAYVSSTLTFYVFAFQDFSTPILIISYILDVFFILKIIFQLNLSYSDKYGNFVVNKQIIRKRYVGDKKILVLDIISNIPLDVIALLAPSNYQFLALSILRLNRICRLYYNYEFYDSKYRKLMLNKIYLKLSWLLFNSILIIHFFACIWYFITCPLGYTMNPTWVTAMNLSKATNFDLYIVSCYYIITLVTTTGYGDIILGSSADIIFSTIFMIIGRFGIALIAGSMAAVISVHSLNLLVYQEKISDLKEHLSRQNLSAYQLDKFWHYAKSLWLKESLKKIPKFIEMAPHVMKCEVMNSMFGYHLSQCYVFIDLDEYFLKHLATYLKRFLYFSGNYIVQQGDIDNTMYFIHKGQVSVLAIHNDMTETIYFKLEENDHFGMKQGLILGMPHHFSYRAENEVEILSLTLNHWQRLIKYFPSAGQKIYQKLQFLPEQTETVSHSLTDLI